MNKALKTIASLMIVILIVILIGIFLSYYRGNDIISTFVLRSGDLNISTSNIPSGDYTNNENSNSSSNEGLIESIIKNSTENNTQTSGDIEKSGDIINSSGEDNNIPNTVIDIPNNEKEDPNQLIISSDPQTSNQEKQEILDEIDKALQSLLVVVGQVEVVDETRLDATLDSEVGEP